MSEWIPYKGDYEKRWYDIKLFNGSIIKECYPNAGIFTDGKGNEYGTMVKYIKPCPHPLDSQ